MNATTKPPIVFWIITIIAILWNLIGVGNWLSQSFLMTDEALATLADAQREFFEATPPWLTWVFAVAVISGLIASILLALRKKLSIPFFGVSLVAVLIQMLYSMFAMNGIELVGTGQAIIFPLFVILVAAFLFYYARKSARFGWID